VYEELAVVLQVEQSTLLAQVMAAARRYLPLLS
jgi:hypothetical protein